MTTKRIILVLLDGLGDRAYRRLGRRTPLQAAATPNLDRLAAGGSTGLYHAARPGLCLPSETAHYLLFGYELEDFPGRGLLEAAGTGVRFEAGDVLALAHLAGVSRRDGRLILERGRDAIEAPAAEIARLMASVSPWRIGEVRMRLEQVQRNDAVLVVSGPVAPYVSDADPIRKGCPVARVAPLEPNPEPEKAATTAAALNAYLVHCHEVLNAAPPPGGPQGANMLLTQRCGRRAAQAPFEQRWGLRGLMIASGAVYAGLAAELGLDFVPAEDTDNPGHDLARRLRTALEDESRDFLHVHTKAPDQAAHGGDPLHKRDVIAALDKGLEALADAAASREDLLVAVTADHSTPSDGELVHSGEPVPVAMSGPRVRRDPVTRFDEVHTAAGCLGLLRGSDLLRMLLNYADRSMLQGCCLGPRRTDYFPYDYGPLPA